MRGSRNFACTREGCRGFLAVEVSYSGGCRNHEFLLLAPHTFQVLSDSVLLEIALIHDANDDPCEAFLSEQLRLRYQETYDRDSLVYRF